MTASRTLPVVGAAVTAPAWIPTLATIAPPLIIGAGIVAALAWLFSDDEKPKAAAAGPPTKPPPAPDAKHVGAGWFEYDAPATTLPAPALTEAERQQRIRDNEAKIARLKREQRDADARLQASRANIATFTQANAVAPVRAHLGSPTTAIPAAPISAPQPAVTPHPPATPAASPLFWKWAKTACWRSKAEPNAEHGTRNTGKAD